MTSSCLRLKSFDIHHEKRWDHWTTICNDCIKSTPLAQSHLYDMSSHHIDEDQGPAMSHNGAGPSMSDPALATPQSFAPFPKLPTELQTKIWKHVLDRSCRSPGIVQTRYDPKSDEFSYVFDIPAALHACQLSRETALKEYPFFTPECSNHISSHASIDILYAKSIFSHLDHNSMLSRGPNGLPPGYPFIDPAIDVSQIRFLILDQPYVTYRFLIDYRNLIPELLSFHALEKLNIVVPSLSQYEEIRKIWRSNRPELFTDNRFDVNNLYEKEIERDDQIPECEIPRFKEIVFPTNYILRLGEYERLFGWSKHLRNFTPTITKHRHLNLWNLDPFWKTREIPELHFIRRV